ncbi:MAG TPA: saccharopine dehydrogenase NADP-binding domain-containing protein [Candidatus Binatia bacterium]|nr:saccharopine dehydrogenase NADP-binding domain-containing protein [Candidatus Binatia bacterium]
MAGGRVLLYGSTGFTGKLILARALAAGLRPVLAGRDAAGVRAVAAPLGLAWRAAPVTDPAALDAALRDVDVVLNAAGPFADTALPLARAAARRRAHYLDVCGEVDVIEALARRHAEWRAQGVMVMPAVGFDVVPSDCLAVRLVRESPGARTLRIGIQGLYLLSRGSAETLAREWGRGIRLRRDGRIETVPPGAMTHAFDYGDGPRTSLLVSWGDVASAYYSTGIPNVETYFAAGPALQAVMAANRLIGPLLSTAPAQALMQAWHALLPAAPPAAMRERVETVVVAEIEAPSGARRAARVRAGDSYEFTAASATVVARRVAAGEAVPGFQTPARVFGPELLAEVPASAVERAEAPR